MRKLYTYNHKNSTTCNDFEVKFDSYLDFIKNKNLALFNLFNSNSDFKISDITEFKEEYQSFFDSWLKFIFDSKINDIESLRNNIKTTDLNFDEFFAYYNFYKKITAEDCEEMFVYDITLLSEEKEFLRLFMMGEKVNADDSICKALVQKEYLAINQGRITPEFKTISIKEYICN